MNVKQVEKYLFEMVPEIMRKEYTWKRIGMIMDHLKDIPYNIRTKE